MGRFERGEDKSSLDPDGKGRQIVTDKGPETLQNNEKNDDRREEKSVPGERWLVESRDQQRQRRRKSSFPGTSSNLLVAHDRSELQLFRV